MVIKLFVSRTSGNLLMRLKQEHIKRILETKNIDYQEIDISDPRHFDDRDLMQNKLKLTDDDLVALPPQIFHGPEHVGDYETFFDALENEHLFEYLNLDIPPHEVEYARKYHRDVTLEGSVHEVSFQQ